ncbi:MAG: GAF domain-containing protein [Deltaproteobacteria bacterium]|nr:GAF domain-containing protein [Deltaproteobacteria bacterium]
MALFEVFIPTTDPNGFNITARIRADSWIQALKSGLARLGDTADVKNVMCDITEQGIDVTEPTSGRVFRIRELQDAQAPQAPAQAPVAPRPAAPAPVASVAPPAAAPPAAPAAVRPVISSAPPPAARKPPPPAVVAPPPAAPPPPAPPAVVAKAPLAPMVDEKASVAPPPVAAKAAALLTPTLAAAGERFKAEVEEETVREERPAAVPVAIGRGRVENARPVEDIIAELFEATQAMYDKSDFREAAQLILDLAHKCVPSDSGSVFVADFNRGDLFFAAATGPKAKEVMKFRIGMGQGIVGFSAQEGVSLAVSDVHRDPRFYAKISQALGYETKSILCAAAQSEGRVYGAVELINKSSGSSFTGDEMNLLNYLAHEFADYLMNTGQPGDLG